MESTSYCISRSKAAGRGYFCRGNMIGNTMKLIMLFDEVKSMLKVTEHGVNSNC